MRYERGIDARVVCHDAAGRFLLLTGADGIAYLPGGAVDHGEHPADAVVRWASAQTPAPLSVRAPVRVVTDVAHRRERDSAGLAGAGLAKPGRGRGGWRGGWVHRDTIVFAGELAASAPGTPGTAGTPGVPGPLWVAPADLTGLRLAPATTSALGLAGDLAVVGRAPRRVSWAAVPPASANRRQRFAAYGFVTDPAGRVLLTLIADGYPGAGRWHLPGGGTDFGEPAMAALHREIAEETGQQGEIGGLLRVSHRHQIRHEGQSVDWHGVRVTYAVRVGQPSPPRVQERGGSTARAGWFPAAQALELPLTEVALQALIDDQRPA
jgi:ADP-ribose pyrophosphatase YjhB (NUDIX family)